MKKISLLFVLLFATVLGYSQVFLEVTGLPGATGEQPVLSYSFGASNPINIGSQSSGAGAGKVSYSSFNLLMQRSPISLALLKAVGTGSRFTDAKVKIYDNTGKKVVYQITLTGVFVESWQQSAGCGTKDCDKPTESVSFVFGKIRIDDFENKTSTEYNVETASSN